MSRSAPRLWIKNALLVLTGIVAVGVGWISLSQILQSDAFAKFQPTGVPVGAEAGVTMKAFHMKAYEKGRLAAEADVDEVEVRRDRSQMLMTGVTDGKFHEDDGDTYTFDMPQATYHYFQDRLEASRGAHVAGEDMDLNSDRFNYDKASKTLLVRGMVQGELHGGAVKADDLSLSTDTKELRAQNVLWIGEIEVTQEGQRSEWRLGPGNMTMSADGKTQTYVPGRATDGEVIVAADKVEYTRDTDTLVATGNVRYWGPDANLVCQQATVYRKERRAVMTGAVRMLVKSEDDEKTVEAEIPAFDRVTKESLKTDPQGATEEQIKVLRESDNVRKFPIKVVADRVEYWYRKGERRAVITGRPFARQDFTEGWRVGWAVEAFYDGEKELLTLKSMSDERKVEVVISIGDLHLAKSITLSTKEGDQTMNGEDVSSSMFFDDDETPTRTGGSSGGGSTGGGGGSTTGGR